MGNKNKIITNHDTALVEERAVRQSVQSVFDVVRVLNTPNTLFPWKKITKLPVGTKKDMGTMHIPRPLPTFTKTCLQHPRWYSLFPTGKETPQRTKEVLVVVFKTLRGAICQHKQEEKVPTNTFGERPS